MKDSPLKLGKIYVIFDSTSIGEVPTALALLLFEIVNPDRKTSKGECLTFMKDSPLKLGKIYVIFDSTSIGEVPTALALLVFEIFNF